MKRDRPTRRPSLASPRARIPTCTVSPGPPPPKALARPCRASWEGTTRSPECGGEGSGPGADRRPAEIQDSSSTSTWFCFCTFYTELFILNCVLHAHAHAHMSTRIFREIARFLRNPRKPCLLAIARPDTKKNLIGLIKGYAENR